MKTLHVATATVFSAFLVLSQAWVVAAPGVPAGFSIPKNTLSPDGRYGVLVPDLEHYDCTKHQNQLIEVNSGKLLAVVTGQTGFERMNHGGSAPRWTADGTGLLWIVQGKWFPRAVNYLKLVDGKVAWQANLLELSHKEMLRQTKAEVPEAYAAAVRTNKDNSGFPDGFTIDIGLPSSDPVLPLEFTVDLTSNPKQLEDFPKEAEIRGSMRGVLKSDGTIRWSGFQVRTGADALR